MLCVPPDLFEFSSQNSREFDNIEPVSGAFATKTTNAGRLSRGINKTRWNLAAKQQKEKKRLARTSKSVQTNQATSIPSSSSTTTATSTSSVIITIKENKKKSHRTNNGNLQQLHLQLQSQLQKENANENKNHNDNDNDSCCLVCENNGQQRRGAKSESKSAAKIAIANSLNNQKMRAKQDCLLQQKKRIEENGNKMCNSIGYKRRMAKNSNCLRPLFWASSYLLTLTCCFLFLTNYQATPTQGKSLAKEYKM